MPHFLLRGLGEQLLCLRLAHEILQALARPVPVDHEHDARGHAFERVLERLHAIGLEARLAQHVRLAGVQAFDGARLGHRPGKAQRLEHAAKEVEAPGVQVGIRQAQLHPLHRHHEHVDIVRADVVLDQQPRAIARDRRVQARVRELERCRAVQTAHERADQRAVLLVDLPHVRAVEVFGGDLARHRIELLVQVHHEQVQAVADLAVAVGELRERGALQPFVGVERAQALQPKSRAAP